MASLDFKALLGHIAFPSLRASFEIFSRDLKGPLSTIICTFWFSSDLRHTRRSGL